MDSVRLLLPPIAHRIIPYKTKVNRKPFLSNTALRLIDAIRLLQRDDRATTDQIRALQKRIDTQIKKDRREHSLALITDNLDIRDKWMGLRKLKQNFNPTPYSRRGPDGRYVTLAARPNIVAAHLHDNQWAPRPTPAYLELPFRRPCFP